MIRTHEFPCHLPKEAADELNRESGRVYTLTLVWHYRIYRRKGIWLSKWAAARLGDYMSGTSLHAHSRDAAQQGFYKACKVAYIQRKMGLDIKYPYKRKFYRTTIWKTSGIRLRDGKLLLSRAKGTEPVIADLPSNLVDYPEKSFLEVRLVYDRARKRYNWHAVLEDGVLPNDPHGDKVLAVDLGEMHPMAVANETGDVKIFCARELRAVNQYRNKRLAEIQRKQSAKVKGSRRWKRLQRRKSWFLAKSKRQVRDIEHKITRAVMDYAVSEKAAKVVVGDVRDIADGKRLNTKAQQKISGWSHGRQVDFLTYKLAAEGIKLNRISEAYSSQTCSKCGARHKPNGRVYRCPDCGFVAPRDSVGACGIESLALFGELGRIVPRSTKYRTPFLRVMRSPLDTGEMAWADPHGS